MICSLDYYDSRGVCVGACVHESGRFKFKSIDTLILLMGTPGFVVAFVALLCYDNVLTAALSGLVRYKSND